MAGVSTESLKKVEAVLAAEATADPNHLAEELFAVAEILHTDGGLRRGLTDPARTEEARRGIAEAVFSGKISPAALTVIAEAAAHRWSHEEDFVDALETAAVQAAVISAESRGGAGAVEIVINELLTFINTVESSAQAQNALAQDSAPAEAQKKLARALAGNPTSSEGELLIGRISAGAGTTPLRCAHRFVDIIVKRQNRSIARVTTASPLTDTQIERLRSGLSRIYGRDLKLDISLDPALIGGLKVQVDDDIMDGTVQTRIADLSRAFA